MRGAARHEDGTSSCGRNPFSVHLENEVAVKDVERFLLSAVPVQRRARLRLGRGFHDRVIAISVGAGQFDPDLAPKNLQRPDSACFSRL
jgi:hypothetical protein